MLEFTFTFNINTAKNNGIVICKVFYWDICLYASYVCIEWF